MKEVVEPGRRHALRGYLSAEESVVDVCLHQPGFPPGPGARLCFPIPLLSSLVSSTAVPRIPPFYSGHAVRPQRVQHVLFTPPLIYQTIRQVKSNLCCFATETTHPTLSWSLFQTTNVAFLSVLCSCSWTSLADLTLPFLAGEGRAQTLLAEVAVERNKASYLMGSRL